MYPQMLIGFSQIKKLELKLRNNNYIKDQKLNNRFAYIRVCAHATERDREMRNYEHRRDQQRRRTSALEEQRIESRHAGLFEAQQIGTSPSPFLSKTLYLPLFDVVLCREFMASENAKNPFLTISLQKIRRGSQKLRSEKSP